MIKNILFDQKGILIKKLFPSNKILVKKSFRSKNIFSSKVFVYQKNLFIKKKFSVKRKSSIKKEFDPKISLSIKKKFRLKISERKNIISLKNFDMEPKYTFFNELKLDSAHRFSLNFKKKKKKWQRKTDTFFIKEKIFCHKIKSFCQNRNRNLKME